MSRLRPDIGRFERCGIPEVIYGKGKSKEVLKEVIQEFLEKQDRAIATRVDEEKKDYVFSDLSKDYETYYNEESGTLVVRTKDYQIEDKGLIGIMCAGTSDVPVAEEARVILEELGCRVLFEYDVGIAGIHRVFDALDELEDAQVIIVFAGMEGALPSVVSGLIDKPVIGVPTSVGYGTGEGGHCALNTMLNSCTPVAVVNIDNGFGAAALAYKIIKSCD